jgi:glycolate oxidase
MPNSAEKNSSLISQLEDVVGKFHVLTASEDLAVYECDGESLDVARPDIIVLPSSTEEIQEVVKIANLFNLPIVPRGAGTGLSGGATTIVGGICLALTRMTKLLK